MPCLKGLSPSTLGIVILGRAQRWYKWIVRTADAPGWWLKIRGCVNYERIASALTRSRRGYAKVRVPPPFLCCTDAWGFPQKYRS